MGADQTHHVYKAIFFLMKSESKTETLVLVSVPITTHLTMVFRDFQLHIKLYYHWRHSKLEKNKHIL